MKPEFGIHRFGRLFFKYTIEHYRGYLMSLAVLVGVLVLGGGFMVYMIDVPIDRSLQSAFFLIIMVLAGTVFTSNVFADLGDKKRAAAWLTLPASHIEKYLVAWIYSYLVFIIVYTITFYLSVLLLMNLKHFPNHPNSFMNVFDRQVLEMFVVYACLHAIALCGAIYHEKMHFIKTGFVFFIAIAFLILANKIVQEGMFGRSVEASPPFGNLRFSEGSRITEVYIFQSIRNDYMIFLVTALALIFWVAAYYRLKEKQI